MKKSYPVGNETKFNKFLVEKYLELGSVDEVFKIYDDLPISYAGYQRVLDRWKIVKAAGPNNTLGEALDFITSLVYKKIPFDKLYRNMPSSFKTSAASLYRILSYVKEGVTRRTATALVITPYNSDSKILVATDISSSRMELGKNHGNITIPMGFSRRRDPREDAILRLFQSEVFTKLTLEKKSLEKQVPTYAKPYMYLDIADVRVEVFHVKLSKKYSNLKNFSSFKLKNFKFESISSLIKNNNLRVGVKEAIEGYEKCQKLKKRKLPINPLQKTAVVNTKILSWKK